MRRNIVVALILTLVVTAFGLSAYGFEKTEFVAKCLANGRDYKPCACTYNALPDLPDAYADLAVRWAHEPPQDYTVSYLKTFAKDLVPAGGGRTTQYGLRRDTARPSYFTRLLKSVGTSVAVKWAISLIPGVDGGTSLLVTSATRATGKIGYAQYVFDRHCGKRLQTVMNHIGSLTNAAQEATQKTIQSIGRTIGLSN